MQQENNYLCECVNCNQILIDRNPQTAATMKPTPKDTKDMVAVQDDDGSEFWACPICKSDDNLMDI